MLEKRDHDGNKIGSKLSLNADESALSSSSKEGKVKTDASATSTKLDLSSSTPKSSHKSESFIRKIIETEKIVVKHYFFGVFLSLYILMSSLYVFGMLNFFVDGFLISLFLPVAHNF